MLGNFVVKETSFILVIETINSFLLINILLGKYELNMKLLADSGRFYFKFNYAQKVVGSYGMKYNQTFILQ